MKKNYVLFVFIVAICFASQSARAQRQNTSFPTFKEQLKKSLRSDYKAHEFKSPFLKSSIGEKVGESGSFEVYKLPLDNMYCLKPKYRTEHNFKVWYPPLEVNKMPNPLNL